MVLPWEVYRVFAALTNPPKTKIVAVLAIQGTSVFAAYINTKQRAWGARADEMKEHQVRLDIIAHRFLHHDSWLDLGVIQEFHIDEFAEQPMGELHDDVRDGVKEIVHASRLISPYERNLILRTPLG